MKYYTYLIGWSTFKIYYYGSRTSKKITTPENDLWKIYFTSSTYVKKFIEENGNPDIIQIRKKFNSKEEALEWEKKFLIKVKADKSPSFLNRAIGIGKFHNFKSTPKSEEHKNKIGKAHKGMKRPKSCCDKLSEKAKNKIMAIDSNGVIIKVQNDDPRWLSGELKGHTVGKFCAIDKNGNKFSISKDDPMYISGELVAQSKGRKSKSTILKEQNMTQEEILLKTIIEKFGANGAIKNYIWINNGEKRLRIPKEGFEEFSKLNYKLGRK